MKKLSQEKLVELITVARKRNPGMTQQKLSDMTGIDRTMISRIERKTYIPTIPQLQKLAEVLQFDPSEIFIEAEPTLFTAFRGNNLTDEEKDAKERMMELIFAARQQLLIRKAFKNE